MCLYIDLFIYSWTYLSNCFHTGKTPLIRFVAKVISPVFWCVDILIYSSIYRLIHLIVLTQARHRASNCRQRSFSCGTTTVFICVYILLYSSNCFNTGKTPLIKLSPQSINHDFDVFIYWFIHLSMDLFIYLSTYSSNCFNTGKTPLIKLSPKKTWEGFMGGFITTIVFGLWVLFFPRYIFGLYIFFPSSLKYEFFYVWGHYGWFYHLHCLWELWVFFPFSRCIFRLYISFPSSMKYEFFYVEGHYG